jgi:hypothetical protein
VRRPLTCLICLLLLCGRSLHAQYVNPSNELEIGDVRLSVSAFYAFPYARIEDRTIVLTEGNLEGRFRTSYGQGFGAGALAEVVAAGPLRGAASIVLLTRAAGVTAYDAEPIVAIGHPPGTFLYAAIGAVLRSPERTPDLQQRRASTALRAGPAYAVEIPQQSAAETAPRAMGSWGVSLGVEGEIPLSHSATLQLGADDFILFANSAELERRIGEDFARAGLSAQARVYTTPAHAFMARLGIAFTFR